MSFLDPIRQLMNSEKWITVLFSLLLISFPFGSHILSFSIGFMTIYPFLIILLILTFFSFFHLKKIRQKLDVYLLFILVLWLVYSVIQTFFVEGMPDAIIDLRSIVLMLLVTTVFVTVKYILGFSKWTEIISFQFKIILFIFLAVAVFEFFTGIHFAGEFTEKILFQPREPIETDPVFVYDNPNNFCTYFVLVAFLVLLTEKKVKEKGYLVFCVLISTIFISVITESRIMFPFLLLVAIVFIFLSLTGRMKFDFSLKIKRFSYVLIAIFLLVFLFSKKELFYMTHDDMIAEAIRQETAQAELDSLAMLKALKNATLDTAAIPNISETKDTISNYYKNANPNAVILMEDVPLKSQQDSCYWLVSSVSTRKSLFLNGFDFFTSSHFLGIGPGQFRHRHQIQDIKYYARKNNGPHFWLMEILSQYGILIFGVYLTLFAWIKTIALRNLRTDFFKSLLVLIGMSVFLVASILPSGFLILDINWIFVAILTSLVADPHFFDLKTKHEE